MAIKKLINTFFFSLMLAAFCQAQTTADVVVIHDTRDIDDAPTAFNNEVRFDFKYRTTVGVPGQGTYSGQMTIAPWRNDSGRKHHQLNFNEGGIFYRTGLPEALTWEGWRKLVIEDEQGNVGIGTTDPQAKLAVEGNILAKEIKIKTDISVPDYVFEPDYELASLKEIQAYIKQHKHLPEIPSATDIEREGLDLAEMNLLLLKKVEELTLHLIEKEQQFQNVIDRLVKLEKTISPRYNTLID